MDMIKALTLDIKNNAWDTTTGFTLKEVPRPSLNEAENPEDATSVILKVRYTGFCGTDRGIWYRQVFKDLFHSSLEAQHKTQRVLGHEFVGEIVEAGSMVKTLYWDPDPKNIAKVEVGSWVSGDSHVTCGRCYQCRIGEGNVCMNEAILGISIDGVFAEYVKLPAKNLWPVDIRRVRPEVASIYDPFGNAVHAVTKVDTRGQRVGVFGCGPIGLFSILLLQNFGAAKIIAIDTNPANLEMAKQLGAHETILVKPGTKEHNYDPDPQVQARILELTYGKGVDVAMEMAGPSSSLNNAMEATRWGGHVVLFGLKDGDLTIPKFSRYIVKGLTFHCVIGRQIFKTWQTSQRVLANQANGIQDNVWNVILKKGEDTIIPLTDFDAAKFEQSLNAHPKVIFGIHR